MEFNHDISSILPGIRRKRPFNCATTPIVQSINQLLHSGNLEERMDARGGESGLEAEGHFLAGPHG